MYTWTRATAPLIPLNAYSSRGPEVSPVLFSSTRTNPLASSSILPSISLSLSLPPSSSLIPSRIHIIFFSLLLLFFFNRSVRSFCTERSGRFIDGERYPSCNIQPWKLREPRRLRERTVPRLYVDRDYAVCRGTLPVYTTVAGYI